MREFSGDDVWNSWELCRTQEQIEKLYATASLTAQEAFWVVEPEAGACDVCKKLANRTFTEEPKRPHPHCRCKFTKFIDGKSITLSGRHYVVGRRPLDNDWKFKVNKYVKEPTVYKESNILIDLDLIPEHQQFIDSDGKNFGFFGEGGVRPDKSKHKDAYILGNKKYRAEFIEEAKKKVSGKFTEKDYGLILNNCQDYIEEVVEEARNIAESYGMSLEVDE